MWRGDCTGLPRVTLVDGDDLEGWQVQMGETGILQVVEVPLSQGVPVSGTLARYQLTTPRQGWIPRITLCCHLWPVGHPIYSGHQ